MPSPGAERAIVRLNELFEIDQSAEAKRPGPDDRAFGFLARAMIVFLAAAVARASSA
jgi:hypothetical protein